MNSPGKRWVMIPAAAAVGVILVGLLVKEQRPPVPDEKAAGVAALAREQDGPGYFHAVKTEPTPFDEGGPWIAVDQAQAQMERVIGERHLSAEQAKTVKALLFQLAEPHPSRAVGGERIQLVKLNLALDGVR